MSPAASINVKASNDEGEIRRFTSEPSFAALNASLASRFYDGESLKVTYKDDSDDDVCLSNDEDLQTALQITGGAKPLRLKVVPRKDLLDPQALKNLHLDEHRASDVYVAQPLGQPLGQHSPPLKKQFKIAIMSDPSLLTLMQDPALGAEEKARALPSPELQQWFLDNQHVATEKLAKLQTKMDCGHFGRAGGFGKGKGGGGGKCGKGKGKGGGWDGKGGKGGGPNHHVHHAVNRLQHVLSKRPEIAQQLLAEPHKLQPLEQFHKLHQFCLNHPDLLREQLELFRAAQASTEQQWVPMRHRIVRYLSNHAAERAALRSDGSVASVDAVLANKPGMLRFLQSNPSELPALLDEAEAVVASRADADAGAGGASGVKRAAAAADGEKKEKKLAEKQLKKAKKLEHKQLKVRVKVVKFLVKHQKQLATLRADPSAETAATVFAAKPKLKLYLAENADTIPLYVEEAVAMSAEVGSSSSSSDDDNDRGASMDMDEGDAVVVVTPDMAA